MFELNKMLSSLSLDLLKFIAYITFLLFCFCLGKASMEVGLSGDMFRQAFEYMLLFLRIESILENLGILFLGIFSAVALLTLLFRIVDKIFPTEEKQHIIRR